MALNSTHPKYAEHIDSWRTMRDTSKGSAAVKAAKERYLPPTQGMRIDGMKSSIDPGRQAYDAYLLRSVFHDYVGDAIRTYLGMLFRKPPVIELPSKLDFLRTNATTSGESLEILLRKIYEEQLTTGRLGLLLDLPSKQTQNPSPYIATYVAETILNWDDNESGEGRTNLEFVVLDESGSVRASNFEWNVGTKYRVLQLGKMTEGTETEDAVNGVYKVGLFGNSDELTADYDESVMKEPVIYGKALNRIPFVFINPSDLASTPSSPPLLGLAELALAIYRGEADYRQNLFMQGQDTLVVIGGVRKKASDPSEQTPLRVGAGSMIETDIGGDAKYVGVSSQGLSEQRTALENDKRRAEAMSGRLATQTQPESGYALQMRIGAQTASLNQIARTGAAGLERILKDCAEWMGVDSSKVVVIPNLEFGEFELPSRDLVDLMTAKNMGAPISRKSIHCHMTDRGLTTLPYEEELAEIEKEESEMSTSTVKTSGTKAGGNPDPKMGNEDENDPEMKSKMGSE